MDDAGVTLDWKATGRDVLRGLSQAYPPLAFLRGADFEVLQAHLANESAESCFDALSGYLRAHDHQLWSIDTGSDAWRLHVVARTDAETFAAAHGAEDGRCERLAPDAPAWKARKAPKYKPAPLVEATDWHRCYGGLFQSGCTLRHAVVPFENDTGAFELLVDLSRFPPEEMEAEGFFALRAQGHRFHPVHAVAGGHYWEWEPATARKGLPRHRRMKLVRISDYRTPELAEVEGSECAVHDGGERTGWGDALCFVRTTRPGADWFDAGAPVLDTLAPVGGGEEALVSLLCVDDRRLRHLASLSRGNGVRLTLVGPIACWCCGRSRGQRRRTARWTTSCSIRATPRWSRVAACRTRRT